jgi:hypothetical protein
VRSVTEVIAAFSLALREHDTLNAITESACLESDQFRNEADWDEILDFYQQHNLDARLEVMTRSLIKSGNFCSYRPHVTLAALLVKSGRKDQARAVVEEYKLIATKFPANKWELVSLLYSVDDFAGCLAESRDVISESKGSFPFLVMEAKALSMLNDLKTAKSKLKTLSQLASGNPGNLMWYASIAAELGERGLSTQAVLRLMKLISNGHAKLSEGAVHTMQLAGYAPELYGLIRTADPAHYETLPEFEFVFELAKSHGTYATALKFGAAILATAPDHKSRPEIEELSITKGFLMI